MTAKQIRLIPEAEKVQQELVDLLNTLLDEAKRGEIDGIYGVTTKPNGNQETVCSASLSVTQKMGCMMQAVIDLATSRKGP